MNIFILTQEDSFYIPRLLQKFFDELPSDISIAGASVLKGELDKKNIGNYLRLLGIRGTLLNGFHFARYFATDKIDRIFQYSNSYSVEGALTKNRVSIIDTPNINSSEFFSILDNRNVDLVVSIACPQIVKKSLLNQPPKGVINIHGALLPKYRGKLPSFWVLANDEEKTGVTVHYMNEKLDDGPIIVQKEVPISEKDTLHSLILKSKVQYGAKALAEAVAKIGNGEVKTLKNDSSEATYYKFPDEEAIKRFYGRGKKIR